MNGYHVYDFDGTIYAGDSSKDFFLFVLRRHPRALLTIPSFLWHVGLYAGKRCTKEQMKERFFAVVRYVPDIDEEVRAFWKHYAQKIYNWYSAREHDSDIIISASPEFLLAPIMESFQVVVTIGTVVDPNTGRFLSKNCYGAEKCARLNKIFDTIEISEFYFDSWSDAPLAQLAVKAYQVDKRGDIKLVL